MSRLEFVEVAFKTVVLFVVFVVFMYAIAGCSGGPEIEQYTWPNGETCEAAYDGTIVYQSRRM
jgi:hypothetical protein